MLWKLKERHGGNHIGRRRKETAEPIETPIEGKPTCPICGKEFKPDDDTVYMFGRNYTCSWACFIKGVKESIDKKKGDKI